MKKLSYLFLVLFSSLLLFSCREDHTDPVYNGDSLLHFNFGTSLSDFVNIGTASKEVEISYGTLKGVSGSHTVNLELDAANSTAVLGTDFQIIKGVDDLASGETGGTFKVRILEPMLGQNKKAVFKLKSSTLGNAVFDQTYTLEWKLQCLIDDFIGTGNFHNSGWWIDPTPQADFVIETDPAQPGKMFVRDFFDVGRDFVIDYDSKANVSFESQLTGFNYTYQGVTYPVSVRMNTDPTKVSVADFCSRTMVLQVQYYFVTTSGSTLIFNGPPTETFTGF